MGQIVVGVDGSAGSLEALRFALREAAVRGCSVTVLSAFRLPLVEAPDPFLLAVPVGPGSSFVEVQEAVEREAERLLDDALAATADEANRVEVERRVVEADPARALLDGSGDADLLVVGARGHGGLAGLLLGSVADQLVRHSSCPVVVVPGGREGRR
ncbi:MAG: universal stress protein [Gaiellales bacterium]